jgi:hypothetical protein
MHLNIFSTFPATTITLIQRSVIFGGVTSIEPLSMRHHVVILNIQMTYMCFMVPRTCRQQLLVTTQHGTARRLFTYP